MEFMLLDIYCEDSVPEIWTGPLTGDAADVVVEDRDDEPPEPGARVVLFGRMADGRSIAVHVQGYKPSVRLQCPAGTHERTLYKLDRFRGLELSLQQLPLFYGFVPTASGDRATVPVLTVKCETFRKARGLAYNSGEGFTTLDSGLLPSAKFANETGITPCGWVQVSGATTASQRTSCDVEVNAFLTQVKASEASAIAPLKIMSFDAEMFSHDGLFPQVLKGDKTIAVCCTMWTYGQPDLKRTGFLVWTGEGVVPIEHGLFDTCVMCKDSADLFEQLRDYVVRNDPDILTGWNIYGFDMPFLLDEYNMVHERPSHRGSEAVHAAAMRAVGKPRETLQDLLKLMERRSVHFKVPDGISHQTFGLLRKPDELGEDTAKGLRALARKALSLPLEPVLVGTDLPALRAYTGPEADLIHRVILTGRRVSAKRGLYMSRFLKQPIEMVEKRMASAARGDNTYHWWGTTGRVAVDLMQIIKDDKKLEDNTLKFTAQQYLDAEFGKLDMTAPEMFKAFRTSNAAALGSMMSYCARDADIPALLMRKLSYVPIWVEMSRVTVTPLGAVLNGGQQRKVYNLIARFVHNKFAINKPLPVWPVSQFQEQDKDQEAWHMQDALKKVKPDYQGATVIEPKAGFYQDAISTCDFESLYPSIMIRHNLCPSVLLPLEQEAAAAPLIASGRLIVERHTIRHSILVDPKADRYEDFDRVYTFVKNVAGVVPLLLQHLLKARKLAKKDMAAARDDFERAVQNGRQLALKVCCNSAYGFFGTSPRTGMLSCKPIAAVTTLTGRAYIEYSKQYVERTWPGSVVVYGDTDSIMVQWRVPGAQGSFRGATVPEAYALADVATADITTGLRNGLNMDHSTVPVLELAQTSVTLANEKVYWPYLLIQKKNYAGRKYTLRAGRSVADATMADFEDCIDMKGIDAVRRDRSKLVRTVSEDILDALLVKNSLASAMEALKVTVSAVVDNSAPLDWFILSKSLKGSYASENQPHVRAWQRMQARGDQDVPEVGTRMPYVIVAAKAGASANGPLYERTEHPAHVQAAKLRPCPVYYLENAQDVVERLLGPTGQGPAVKSLFTEGIERAKHKATGNMSLMSFLKKPRLT